MKTDNLLYIEDTKKRKLYYHFTPASITSNFVPLVVIFDDEIDINEIEFEYKMWNILRPINTFKSEDEGLAWLGVKDDFYVKDLLHELINEIAEDNECDEYIFTYSSNTQGGYGAILHGILSKANAVYAQAPLIQLENNIYNIDSNEGDLSRFLNKNDSFPIFYLCDNKEGIQESKDMKKFTEKCAKNFIRFHTDFCPSVEGNEKNNLKKVLDMFERMTPEE